MTNFEPQASLGTTKYGPYGLFTCSDFDKFGLKHSHKKLLETAANYSLSKKSWGTYKTAERMLERCQEETSSRIQLPMKEKDVLLFLAWLVGRGLQARTISLYLSGIRMLHLRSGFYIPALRTELVKQILEGRTHLDAVSRRLGEKLVRLLVTPTLLKLIKLELKETDLSKEDKRLLWAVATVGFAGGFRIHELLAIQEATFDPLFTLLGSDITLRSDKLNGGNIETLQIKLKSQKSIQGRSQHVGRCLRIRKYTLPSQSFQEVEGDLNAVQQQKTGIPTEERQTAHWQEIQQIPETAAREAPGLREATHNLPLL